MTPTSPEARLLFVVKEHKASSLHWDLRFQYCKEWAFSWALHHAPHLDPYDPIHAGQVDDHQVAYFFSEWIIPLDRVGAGPTAVWDKGFYDLFLGDEPIRSQLSRGYLRVSLAGTRLKGAFSLTWIGPGPKDWSWSKEMDEDADPSIRFPRVLTPEKLNQLKHPKRFGWNPGQMNLFPWLE